jgi:hypothetical protein
METRPLLILLALFVGSAALADAYTWTDDEGIVHYSDRPHPGAKRIIIDAPKPSRARSLRPTSDAATAIDASTAEDAARFRYIEGVLNVSLALSPALRPGHQVRVYFDGTPQTVNGTSFQLQEVWRGVHNLQAEVVDETGQMTIRTQANRFYVQQSTVR